MDLGPGGELGVDSGATQKVEGQDGLGQEPVPQMEGVVTVRAAEASNEVVFEGADGTFSSIASVDARGN